MSPSPPRSGPRRRARTRSATLVADAAERGLPVRVAGAGIRSRRWSRPTDCCSTSAVSAGSVRSTQSRRRVVVGPATTIGEFGEPLWAEGLALANQGDIIAQQIAGAVSTATHGSGLRLGSFSSGVRRLAGRRLERRRGRDRRGRPEPPARSPGLRRHARRDHRDRARSRACLPAARARSSTGAGTKHGSRFDELAQEHRHYSFFWMPSDDSAALYGLASAGESLADKCHVKIYDEVDDSTPDSDEPRRRVGPAYASSIPWSTSRTSTSSSTSFRSRRAELRWRRCAS